MLNFTKGILDPIHNYIPLDTKILKLIDLPIFQRLGYIKQLTSANRVFPGAQHTRKEHSIGVSYIARKYSEHLFPNDSRKALILQIAGLFHDIGHGCYSHAFDSAIYSKIYGMFDGGHDEHRLKILKNILKEPLESINIKIEEIEEIWEDKNKVLSALIQGPLGADRMDFIKRDTTYTGTTHFGIIDIDRIVYNSTIYEKDGQQYLSYNCKIVPDIIQGLRTRLDMYLRVYLHKKVVAASILIEAMMQSSCEILNLIDRTQNLDKFLYLTDEFILNEILSHQNPKMKQSQMFAKALYLRQLPRMISEKKIKYNSRKFRHNSNMEIIGNSDDIKDYKFIWRSRILSNDFAKDFDKLNIYIYDGSKYKLFSKYWKPDFIISEYYIERIYSYE